MAGVFERQPTETQMRSMDWLLMEVMVRSMDMRTDTLRVGIADTVSENVMDTLTRASIAL